LVNWSNFLVKEGSAFQAFSKCPLFVASKISFIGLPVPKLDRMTAYLPLMLKKNLSIIFILLLSALLIAMVVWVYDKRIKSIEVNMKTR